MADTGAPPRAADMKVPAALDARVLGSKVLAEAARRRAFAVISHPDAGKSTLTEALALHASAITRAGAVHGKAGRRGLSPAPVNWPVGVAGDFRGLIERATGDYVTFTRTPGGAGRALETRLDALAAAARDGSAFEAAQEELALLDEVYGASVDMES